MLLARWQGAVRECLFADQDFGDHGGVVGLGSRSVDGFLLSLLLVFVLAQAVYLGRHIQLDETEKPADAP
mgnify:CR=1 FL=1